MPPGGGSTAFSEQAVTTRLAELIEDELCPAPGRFEQALLVFQHAKELAAASGCNPRVVLPAALLLGVQEDLGIQEADGCAGPVGARPPLGGDRPADSPRIVQLLLGAGLDPDTIQRVCALIDPSRPDFDTDSPESKLLQDALTLARLTKQGPHGNADQPVDVPLSSLLTEAGRLRARSLFSGRP
jgi:hypothetical protein